MRWSAGGFLVVLNRFGSGRVVPPAANFPPRVNDRNRPPTRTCRRAGRFDFEQWPRADSASLPRAMVRFRISDGEVVGFFVAVTETIRGPVDGYAPSACRLPGPRSIASRRPARACSSSRFSKAGAPIGSTPSTSTPWTTRQVDPTPAAHALRVPRPEPAAGHFLRPRRLERSSCPHPAAACRRFRSPQSHRKISTDFPQHAPFDTIPFRRPVSFRVRGL
jgi:hypothetical protein